MAGYELERLWIFPKQLPRTQRAVLMVDPMKSVAANAFLEPFIRTGIDGRRCGHLLVKSRIENRDLRNVSQNLLDNVHAFQFCLNMQRRKCRNALNFRVHNGRNCDWIREMWAAVHHSVSDDVNVRFGSNRPRITIPRAAQQTLYDLLARGTLYSFFQNGPWRFFTERDAELSCHSILPSHNGVGGTSGGVSPISYRHALWLLEPALSTSIFIVCWRFLC